MCATIRSHPLPWLFLTGTHKRPMPTFRPASFSVANGGGPTSTWFRGICIVPNFPSSVGQDRHGWQLLRPATLSPFARKRVCRDRSERCRLVSRRGEITQYGFGLYSARYGNIYTARRKPATAEEAFRTILTCRLAIWERTAAYSMRCGRRSSPKVFLRSAVREQRRYHLRCVREVITSCDVFVFTLGLTESPTHARTGDGLSDSASAAVRCI